MIGQLLDQRYKIIKALSEGAFGHTYQAEDTKRPQNQLCVVKKLKQKQSHSGYLIKAKELFDREAKTLEKLGTHPHIPRLLAHLAVDGEFYLVEEYIAGKTLAEEFAHEEKKQSEKLFNLYLSC